MNKIQEIFNKRKKLIQYKSKGWDVSDALAKLQEELNDHAPVLGTISKKLWEEETDG